MICDKETIAKINNWDHIKLGSHTPKDNHKKTRNKPIKREKAFTPHTSEKGFIS
jgi:hypothetical protein